MSWSFKNMVLACLLVFSQLSFAQLYSTESLQRDYQSIKAIDVNMERYIRLSVQDDEDIVLGFVGFEDSTDIKIESGTKVYNLTIDADWKSGVRCLSEGNTMTIYGNLTAFNCFYNGEHITGVDASHNDILSYLDCGRNNLSVLNVANGNNANMVFMGSDNNPLLACIQHDADFDPNSNACDMSGDAITGWCKSSYSEWSIDCGYTWVDEVLPETTVSIYPNPFSSVVTLSDISGIERIEVLNADGRLLKSLSVQKEINLSDLDLGVYFIKLFYRTGLVKTLKAVRK